jgi:hypothetical protein
MLAEVSSCRTGTLPLTQRSHQLPRALRRRLHPDNRNKGNALLRQMRDVLQQPGRQVAHDDARDDGTQVNPQSESRTQRPTRDTVGSAQQVELSGVQHRGVQHLERCFFYEVQQVQRWPIADGQVALMDSETSRRHPCGTASQQQIGTEPCHR